MPTIEQIQQLICINPSWSFVALAFCAMVGYIVSLLIKNTALTTKIFESMDVLHAIRDEQIRVSEEAESQALQISELDIRMTLAEHHIENNKCAKHCEYRRDQ